jgi:hypothetical protein
MEVRAFPDFVTVMLLCIVFGDGVYQHIKQGGCLVLSIDTWVSHHLLAKRERRTREKVGNMIDDIKKKSSQK